MRRSLLAALLLLRASRLDAPGVVLAVAARGRAAAERYRQLRIRSTCPIRCILLRLLRRLRSVRMELRLQVEAREVALKEVQHVHLELCLSGLEQLGEAEGTR